MKVKVRFWWRKKRKWKDEGRDGNERDSVGRCYRRVIILAGGKWGRRVVRGGEGDGSGGRRRGLLVREQLMNSNKE